MRVVIALLALIHLLVVNLAIAGKYELFQRVHRPTIVDLLNDFGEFPSRNPFSPISIHDERVERLMEIGPKLIAQLEFAYPEAVWALLGRDSSFVADILEAYYLSQGQQNRVIRLNASGPSFIEERNYLGLLKSAGLVDSLGQPLKKFVLLDATSWGPESQLRKLLNSVYKNIPSDLNREYLPLVNAVALGSSGRNRNLGQLVQITSSLNVRDFWDSLVMPDGSPEKVLLTYSDFSYLNLRQKNVEIAWHEKFLPFITLSDGAAIAFPGALTSIEIREHLLWFMYEVIRSVHSPKFIEEVKQAAQNKYHFDIERQFRTQSEIFNSTQNLIDWVRLRGNFIQWLDPEQTRKLAQLMKKEFLEPVTEVGHFVDILDIQARLLQSVFEPSDFSKFIIQNQNQVDFDLILKILKSPEYDSNVIGAKIIREIKSYLIANLEFKNLIYSKILNVNQLEKVVDAVEKIDSRALSSFIEDYGLRVLKLDLSQSVLKKICRGITPQAQFRILSLHLRASLGKDKDFSKYFKILKMRWLTQEGRLRLISSSLNEFFQAAPNVGNINDLLQLTLSDQSIQQVIERGALLQLGSTSGLRLVKDLHPEAEIPASMNDHQGTEGAQSVQEPRESQNDEPRPSLVISGSKRKVPFWHPKRWLKHRNSNVKNQGASQ